MLYEKELEFFRKILKNYRIQSYLITQGDKSHRGIDRGIRDFLDMEEDYDQLFCTPHESITENMICKITDIFFCNYYFIILPDTEVPSTFIAGPFIDIDLNQNSLMEIAEKNNIPAHIFSQLQKYYSSVPVYTDHDVILSLFNSFGELLWGSTDKFIYKTINMSYNNQDFPRVVKNLEHKTDDALFTMQMLERRYEGENKMLQAVSQGMTHQAEQILSKSSSLMLEMRVSDPVRNIKNYSIIVNTLLRKSAEQGGVHPLYIDGVSTDFAKRIELIKSVEEGISMHHEMIDRYCNLVKTHSMKKLSPLVQKVIALVDYDITSDLSLSSQAEMLNVNASYLSTLFKKEMGLTLTEYVTKKRIEHASFLLTTTNLQIQTVAQNCGIYDVNYFTKMFKKHTGKTPKEHRENSIKF
ncbi:MAG: helix-turn-helix domain-containing protein [Clostridia bacterium]|nr:helix-turn-helix domain-containing protein [Clostridia bacterium]